MPAPQHHRAFAVSAGWTLLLLLLGSVVHATGSSLACPDWPTCYGTMVPAMEGGVFWEHLHPSTGGVYTQTFGVSPNRRYVVQWDSVVYTSGTTKIDVRAVLKEGRGDIEMCYVNTTSGSTTYDLGIGATSGIHSGTGTTGLQYSCNTASLVNGLVLTYTAP